LTGALHILKEFQLSPLPPPLSLAAERTRVGFTFWLSGNSPFNEYGVIIVKPQKVKYIEKASKADTLAVEYAKVW